MRRFILNPESVDIISDVVVERVSESTDFEVIHLKIYTGSEVITYRICKDMRFPSLDYIYNRLDALATQVKSMGCDILINEYLERDYIFVTYTDGLAEQYTATRID